MIARGFLLGLFCTSTIVLCACAGGAQSMLPVSVAGTPRPIQNWSTYGFDSARSENNPYESAIGRQNIGTLKLLWSAHFEPGPFAQPLFGFVPTPSGNRPTLFVNDKSNIYAIDPNSGSQIWHISVATAPTPCGGVNYMQDTPVLAAADPQQPVSSMYFVDGAGVLNKVDLVGGALQGAWTVDASSYVYYNGGLNFDPKNGKIYIATSANCLEGTYTVASNEQRGKVYAFDTTSSTVSGPFTTVSTAYGGDIWGMGGLAIDTPSGNVYVTTGNVVNGSSESQDYAEHVISLDQNLNVLDSNFPNFPGNYIGSDYDFGAAPTLFQNGGCGPQLAVKNKSGLLFLYNRNALSSGPVGQLQFGGRGEGDFIEEVAYSPTDQMIYVTDAVDSSPPGFPASVEPHGITALSNAGCGLSPAWHVTEGTVDAPGDHPFSALTVANGIVYFGVGNASGNYGTGGQVFAHNTATGETLWSSPTTSCPNSGQSTMANVYQPPVVVNGMLFIQDMAGCVYAYGLP